MTHHLLSATDVLLSTQLHTIPLISLLALSGVICICTLSYVSAVPFPVIPSGGCSSPPTQGNKILNVGEELFKEIMPLHMGSRYYQLKGLKPFTRYEVKISYPASIPAIFSLQLKRENSDVGMNRLRKLLNTEKLIFMTESIDDISSQGRMYVLVTVEPEGVVAIPGVQERESILFNIVCDELVLGIPHNAWLVVIFAVLCLIVGFLVPRFLPPFLLPYNEQKPASRIDKNS